MAIQTRDLAAANLLTVCGREYQGVFSPQTDLPSVQGIVDYTDPVNQRKYVHMYFAKNAGLWRALRSRLSVSPNSSLYSIGAGPCLELFGWVWDAGPHPGPIVAVDALPWSGVCSLQEWKDLAGILVPNLQYNAGYTVPDPSFVTQAGGVAGLQPFPSSSVVNGSTVTFAWTLNHVFGARTPMGTQGRAAFVAWVQDVVARGCRVVIADMQIDSRTGGFWDDIRQTLGVTAEPQPFHFLGSAQPLAALYRDGQGSRRTYFRMLVATVLVLDAAGAAFLT